MPTFGMSRTHPVFGRLVFYSVVVFGLGGLNQLMPDQNRIEQQRAEAAGVARPMIAVPLSELPVEVQHRVALVGNR